ncbi:MAG: type IV pilus assembly protein PilQ, partial [Planctomycetota bacterium]
MATTPLKTASRALSLATLIVAGFSTWLFSTQGSAPLSSTETTSPPKRTIEFAAVTAPATRSQDVVSKSAPRQRLDEGLAKPVSKPAIDDDAFFEDEIAEPTRLADSAKNRHAAPSRSQPRIQPELGRLTARESNPVTPDDLDDLNLTVEDVVRQPRTESRPAAVFRPADAVHDAESARVESQLTSLQKKIDQLAQAQTEQKTNDLQKALETLQQIQESKQSEQFEKLFQQLKDSKQNGTDP